MQMPMKGFNNQPIEDGPEVIAQSENPGIRCFTVQRAPKLLPHDDCSGIWELANEQTVPDFTAAGYFFARKLHASLNVPIGLISSSWGGSSIEAWMPSQTLTDIPEKTLPATEADIKTPPQTPTALYNGMVHPLVGYGIRGVIWYQGESSKEEPVLYVKMFDKMVREWRHLWGEGEFPFYYCQIAPFKYDSGLNSAYIREAQLKGMTTTPNTGMAVLMDANSPKGIHPAKKKDAGERLALWALAKTYGMDIPCRSPEMKSLDREGRLAIITFDYTGAGLTAPNKELKNFEIAGPDQSFHPATATLWDNKVYLFSPEVSEPVAVRYCWNDTSATELFSIEGNLPVSSFRTDEW
jgi:sialate O-acetylesterase